MVPPVLEAHFCGRLVAPHVPGLVGAESEAGHVLDLSLVGEIRQHRSPSATHVQHSFGPFGAGSGRMPLELCDLSGGQIGVHLFRPISA